VGDVVAAVEIIVDVDLPVAIQRIDAAIEVVELFCELKRGNEFGDGIEEFLERHGFAVEIDEDEILPGVEADGDEAVVGAIEIADAVELDHAFEGAVDAVGPAVIGAAKLFGAAVGFGDDGCGVVSTDVEEGAESMVIAADDDDGFAGDVGGEEVAFVLELVEAADGLPGAGEDGLFFERFDLRVAVPGSGDGIGVVKGIVRIVEGEEVVDGLRHGGFLSRNGWVGEGESRRGGRR